MPAKSMSAHVVAKSNTRKTQQAQPPTVYELLSAAETEISVLHGWLKADPETPYIQECGWRLIKIATALAGWGGK